MSLEPGRLVGGNLRLVHLLGRGAMGSVWVADHLGLQSKVAVKFMAAAMLEDPVSVARFRQEAKAAAEIRSPHVVQVFDHGCTEDGHNFIVMELLEGESLEKRIKRLGPLSVGELVMVMTQVCKALAKAHERGIIHRDLKPANIFLIDSGGDLFVKVLDFGVAKFSGEEAIQMTAVGNMVGTPAYMSPEQLFHGQDVDHRGDLWSLAVVAYHALTGVRPFEGVTLGELCVAIKAAQFRPLGELRNDLSPDLDAWFARGLHRDPECRFQTAKELAQSLEAAAGVSSTMGSTPSVVASSPHIVTFPGTAVSSHAGMPLPKSGRRTGLMVVAAALTLVGVVAAAVVLSDAGPSWAPAHAPPGKPTATPAAPDDDPAATTAAPDDQPAADSAAGAAATTGSAEAGASASASASAEAGAPAGSAPRQKPPVAAPPPAASTGPAGGQDERSKRAGEKLGI